MTYEAAVAKAEQLRKVTPADQVIMVVETPNGYFARVYKTVKAAEKVYFSTECSVQDIY